jgi:hypothetical protein
MLDASGIVAQKDSAHPNGVPTSSWRLNKYARDDHVIEVPAQLPPGRYGLRVGAYDAATGVRLPLDGTDTDELWLPDMVRVGGMPSRQSARVEYKLGDAIELVAFEVAETQVGMEQPIDLRLYWRVHAPLLSDYSVFVHLYDETGNLVSVADARPLQGAYLTNQWQVGETIEDRRQIALPAGAEPGNYQLAVGLYDPVSLNRLPVQDQNGQRAPEDAIRLQVVTFGSP